MRIPPRFPRRKAGYFFILRCFCGEMRFRGAKSQRHKGKTVAGEACLAVLNSGIGVRFPSPDPAFAPLGTLPLSTLWSRVGDPASRERGKRRKKHSFQTPVHNAGRFFTALDQRGEPVFRLAEALLLAHMKRMHPEGSDGVYGPGAASPCSAFPPVTSGIADTYRCW